MSEWSDIVDALETEIRAANADIPAGSLGFEASDALGHSLATEKLPHVFARNTVEASDELSGGYGVQLVTVVFTFAIWTRGETKDEAAARLDAIRLRIAANPTLGGVVDFTEFSGRQIEEFPEKKDKQGVFIIRVEVWR